MYDKMSSSDLSIEVKRLQISDYKETDYDNLMPNDVVSKRQVNEVLVKEIIEMIRNRLGVINNKL
jgi:hypothetical protein